PRESRLPQDDERPPEEYDQPWEWKKDRISKAFAGQLKPDFQRRLQWPPQKPPFLGLVETWYHGAISRTDAESLLRLCKEASYLVRNSETSKIDFSLSLK
ncbi:hypothetical protein FKM82_018081, partial [Ascaphus truei]